MERSWENVKPSKLARLLDPTNLGGDEGDAHAGALRQQWAARLLPDLLIVPGVERDRLERLVKSRGHGTFLAELTSTTPSVEVFRAIKDFARCLRDRPENPLHGDPANVLYFAAIAAALRCGECITTLDPAKMREGFRWAMQHPGAEPLREMFAAALAL